MKSLFLVAIQQQWMLVNLDRYLSAMKYKRKLKTKRKTLSCGLIYLSSGGVNFL